MHIGNILLYRATPVNSKYVCLDTDTCAGPMVEAEEWERLVPLAKQYTVAVQRFAKADVLASAAENDHKDHRERGTLTDARYYRLTDKANRWFADADRYYAEVERLAAAVEAYVANSRTLQPLAR